MRQLLVGWLVGILCLRSDRVVALRRARRRDEQPGARQLLAEHHRRPSAADASRAVHGDGNEEDKEDHDGCTSSSSAWSAEAARHFGCAITEILVWDRWEQW